MLKTLTLLADIGATNARFALSFGNNQLERQQVLQCDDFDRVEDAVDAYLLANKITDIQNVCIAAAGPVIDDQIRLTNNHWHVHGRELVKQYQLKNAFLLNDFEAIAYSLPQLSDNQLLPVGYSDASSKQNENFTYVVLGPGSGLGVASLIQRNQTIYPIVTEGGHVGFAPMSDLQSLILKSLSQKYKQISNEMLLSGPGIINIYQTLCEVNNEKPQFQTSAQIGSAADNEEDSLCVQTMELFFEILGQVAGDLALTFAAFQGVYIAGGIVRRYPRLLAKSRFRTGFENKTQHQALLQVTPTYLIVEADPGLIGANYYATSKLHDSVAS